MYSLAELKPGRTIQVDRIPYIVLTAQHSKQARGSGVAKTTIRNLLTGAVVPKTFQGNDRIEPAEVSYSRAQYLYFDDSGYHFMDSASYEQFALPHDQLSSQKDFLIEGSEVDIQNFNSKPIAVKLPPKTNLKVKEAEPGVKGDTASGGSKPAKLETGLTIQVPLFVNPGDTVRVNTETKTYVERV